MPCRQGRLSCRSAALDLPGDRTTDHGGPMGPRPTLAAPPRLFPRRTGPPVRGAHPRARDAWPQRRVGRAASVVCHPASLSLSAWADRRSIPASEPADRRCRVDSGGRRPALPYSTFRADTSPIMVDRSGRAPRRQSRRGSVSGVELDCASRGKSNGPETSERAAGLAKSAPTCARRHIPIQTERRPKRGEHARRRGSSRGAAPDQVPPESTA